jgi:hypothetical protein
LTARFEEQVEEEGNCGVAGEDELVLKGVLAGYCRKESSPALDPSPVIPSDLSFGYLSAELKSPVKISILDASTVSNVEFDLRF